MISFFTPALIFLKAKIKKQSLIYSVNRGQTGKFLPASNKFQGIADVKGVGPFIITENSHTVEHKSKLSLYFAFGEFAATLPLEYATIVQKLRESGKKITNIEDLGELVGMKFNADKKVWESSEKIDPNIPLPKGVISEKEKMELYNDEIKPYKTIQLHNLAYMFPFNITPALVESKIQHMIGLKQMMLNKLTPQYVIMFIMIMMGTALAAMLVSKFVVTGDVTTETTTVIQRVIETSQIQNFTG